MSFEQLSVEVVIVDDCLIFWLRCTSFIQYFMIISSSLPPKLKNSSYLKSINNHFSRFEQFRFFSKEMLQALKHRAISYKVKESVNVNLQPFQIFIIRIGNKNSFRAQQLLLYVFNLLHEVCNPQSTIHYFNRQSLFGAYFDMH